MRCAREDIANSSAQTTRRRRGPPPLRQTEARLRRVHPCAESADSLSDSPLIGGGLNGAVAMIAWLSPAEAARVPWSISVHVAMDSILMMESEPDVCRNSFGHPIDGAAHDWNGARPASDDAGRPLRRTQPTRASGTACGSHRICCGAARLAGSDGSSVCQTAKMRRHAETEAQSRRRRPEPSRSQSGAPRTCVQLIPERSSSVSVSDEAGRCNRTAVYAGPEDLVGDRPALLQRRPPPGPTR